MTGVELAKCALIVLSRVHFGEITNDQAFGVLMLAGVSPSDAQRVLGLPVETKPVPRMPDERRPPNGVDE